MGDIVSSKTEPSKPIRISASIQNQQVGPTGDRGDLI